MGSTVFKRLELKMGEFTELLGRQKHSPTNPRLDSLVSYKFPFYVLCPSLAHSSLFLLQAWLLWPVCTLSSWSRRLILHALHIKDLFQHHLLWSSKPLATPLPLRTDYFLTFISPGSCLYYEHKIVLMFPTPDSILLKINFYALLIFYP